MPRIKLQPFLGINKDLSPGDLPNGAFTDGTNVRFRKTYAELFLGQVEAYPTAPIAPISAFPVDVGTTPYWIALGTQKAYCVTGTPAVWTNITRQTAGVDVNYAATAALCWNGGVLNGVPVLNNGIDPPQAWTPVSTSQRLAILPNWPANFLTRVIRPFKNYLFALGVTNASSQYFPHRVKWSTGADPGTLPATWDATVSGSEAGEFDLEGSSPVVDCLPLRGSLIVYKQKSTHVITYVGGQFVFQQNILFATSGILSQDCVTEIEGAHVVMTTNDVIIHDGQTIKSLLDKVTREWLFANIDQAGFGLCFVTRNLTYNEVWVCFPELGKTRCSKALVINIKDGTSSFRDLPNVTSANVAYVDDSLSSTWNGQTGPWDASPRKWNQNEYGAGQERLMLCAPDRPALVLVDSGTLNFGAAIPGYMLRTGMSLGDENVVKTTVRLIPAFENVPSGTQFKFQLGGSMTLNGAITWGAPITYTQGTNYTVDGFASGRYLAYQITTTTATQWRLSGMSIEVKQRGGY